MYSDTGREEEIKYDRAEDYELDDPWKRIVLLRSARTMKCLYYEPAESGVENCNVEIYTDEEPLSFSEGDVKRVPLDPGRV